MTPQLVGIFAAICAANARIEAMKAHDKHREMIGDTQMYAEGAYLAEAALLESLSIEARIAQ